MSDFEDKHRITIEKGASFDHYLEEKSEVYEWNKLKNKAVLISGATGLIGSNIVKYLLDISENNNLSIKVLALIRSKRKADTIFGDLIKNQDLKYIIARGGVERLPDIDEDIDYIIHGANPTASKYFIEHPVETINIAVYGTNQLLKLAKKKNVKGFIYLSTMEIYGEPMRGEKVTEDDCGSFDATVIRNCYPLSKQFCENLCCSYFVEYGVPVKIARLAQTFGPGVEYNDSRVFAEFGRCAIEHRNIILKTKGKTERCYLYTMDAVTAILTILVKGEAGQAYTVANEDTYCSIYNMAKFVAEKYGIEVEIHEQDIASQGYANTVYMDLDTTKLRLLGWKPKVGLEEMYGRMIESMKKYL